MYFVAIQKSRLYIHYINDLSIYSFIFVLACLNNANATEWNCFACNQICLDCPHVIYLSDDDITDNKVITDIYAGEHYPI